MKLVTRFNIIGVEVIGLAAFLLALVVLELYEAHWEQIVQNFSWVYAIIGVALILVGFETLSLTRHLS